MRAMRRLWLIGGMLLVLGCHNPPSAQRPEPIPPDMTPVQPAPVAAPVQFTLARSGLPEAGNWKCDPAFADVNGDGFMDLAGHVRLGEGPQVWLGDGQGNWQPSSEGLDFGKDCSPG